MYGPTVFHALATALILPRAADALCIAECGERSTAEDFSIEYTGRCTPYYALDDASGHAGGKGKLPSEDHACLVCLYNAAKGARETEIKNVVTELCLEGYKSHEYPYGEITGRGAQFDREHYAGGGEWNYEIETAAGEDVLKEDAARLYDVYYYQAKRLAIEFPDHIETINPYVEDGSHSINGIVDTDGCDLNSVYCCFVQDRQADDDNGNCAAPYEHFCWDRDPADNTNLCYVDHARASKSSGMDSGFSVFGDLKTGKEDVEGPAHCHGFVWPDDPLHPDAIYKGNLMFYVTMYDHLTQRGYVRNVPGSPMCGCAENMAVVTRADCTQIDVDEKTTFKWTAETNTLETSMQLTRVNYNSCTGLDRNNNLYERAKKLHADGKLSEAKKDALGEVLVGSQSGQCNAAIEEFLRTKNVTRYGGETAMA